MTKTNNKKNEFSFFLGLNQCKLLSCSHGQDCEIDKQGITNCVCSHNCQPIVRPVCATNGRTYDNLCEMEKNGCQDREELSAKYFGICGNYNSMSYSEPKVNSPQWSIVFIAKTNRKLSVTNSIIWPNGKSW